MSKKILSLDLGITSIGYAVAEERQMVIDILIPNIIENKIFKQIMYFSIYFKNRYCFAL